MAMSEEQREEGLRLFAAVQLPEEWLRALAAVRRNLEVIAGGELRWVRPELMHVTLVFLGNQPSALLSEIESAMESAAAQCRPFGLSLGRLGVFGPPHGITVLWAGLAEIPPAMRGLHAALTSRLSDLRIASDGKPLVPHITLARGKRPIDRTVSLRISSAVQSLDLPRSLSTPVGAFVLMKSRLSPKGPSYELVRSFHLGSAGNE
jgi:RNA 2',3'-cyclic 3'-phosphodiesterase